MNLLDSLLDAIVRLDGDALVMHVGEKPYVVTTTEATAEFRGPLAWGQVELSSRVLTLDAVTGMVGQILPIDQRAALDEYGATEYEVAAVNNTDERFTIIAARGGEDIWLEVRRHPKPAAVAQEPAAAAPVQHAVEQAAADVIGATHERDSQVATPAAEAAAVVEELVAEPVFATASEPQVDEKVGHAHQIAEQETDALPDVPIEEVLALDHEIILPDSQIAAEDQDWTDDVMTEGDLGELLRASAASVVTGEPEHHVYDLTAVEFDEPLTVPEVPEDDLLMFAEESVESSPAAEPVDPDAEPVPIELPSSLQEAEPIVAGKDPALAAREALLAEQEQLFGRLEAEASSASTAAPTAAAGQRAPAAPTLYAVAGEEPLVADDEELTASEFTPEATHVFEEPALSNIIVLEPVAASAPLQPEAKQEPPRAAPEPEPIEEEVPPARPAAVVLSLTRAARTETATDGRGAVGTLERVLRLAAARGAATVYLVAQSAPMVRVDGEFSPLDGEPTVNASLLERIAAELAPRSRDGSASPSSEWLIDVPEIGRVRCMSFRDHRGPGLTFRMVPPRAIAADQLGLPAEVQGLCSEAEGLVLVAGGRGSGKSTLLTSFVDLINRTRSDHVITVESQIEFVHENNRSFVSQREVRGDSDAVALAVRTACREEPDVLIVEDMRAPELVSLALEAAEAGRLVFGTVPAPSAVSAIERIIEMFPAERREKVQASLASTLRGVVSQLLLRKLKGGRIAAREVLLNSPAVANVILEGKSFQLPAALENGRRVGMMPFAESLATLVRDGIVHPAHAYRRAPNRDQFLAILRREGIDISNAERLA